ncbi:hypothetical protein GCM10018785_34190 [Streptomyces longispororuber]|uniref:Uncharacterized protein n=1 Tax=Streptomyces longispororuber TaxID=68230 RepID=A0A919DM70_9ACTN|nr:hypothetical protein [Streptomyces longispororuber]GHE62386.1 hypothetical protein GCM10018785_34190 [Streptomyces longispororuber]
MTHRPDHRPEEPADTAAEEVFEEAEDAATRHLGDDRDAEKDSEAADPLTPSVGAQEDARRGHGGGKA